MPGQEILYRGENVVLYRSVSGGRVELEKYTGLSPYDCKYSTIIRVDEDTGVVVVRHVSLTCSAGAHDIAVVVDRDLAREFAARIRNMKAGHEDALRVFGELYGIAVGTARRRDEEISKALEELIDALGEVEVKSGVLELLRRAREGEEARRRLLSLIEGCVLEDDP